MLFRNCIDTVLCAQAQAMQEANRLATNRWPPFWAIAAMVLLGFDEFVAVLYNPLWLLLGLVVFLFAKTVYQASSWHIAVFQHVSPDIRWFIVRIVSPLFQAPSSVSPEPIQCARGLDLKLTAVIAAGAGCGHGDAEGAAAGCHGAQCQVCPGGAAGVSADCRGCQGLCG
jgi:hypothetical protein